MPKFKKGSQEAKDYMASIRKKRTISGKGQTQGKAKKPEKKKYGSLATENEDAMMTDISSLGAPLSSAVPVAVAQPIGVVAIPEGVSDEVFPDAPSVLEDEERLLNHWEKFRLNVKDYLFDDLDISYIALGIFQNRFPKNLRQNLKYLAVYLDEETGAETSEVEENLKRIRDDFSKIKDKRGLTENEKKIKVFLETLDDELLNLQGDKLNAKKFTPMKMGKGMKGSCPCGKSKKRCSCPRRSVAGRSANPNAPPPPPPTRPPPIITDFNPLQVELEHLLELLQTQLTPRRRTMIETRVEQLRQQLAGNPQSGAGIISDVVGAFKSGAKKVGEYVGAVVMGRGENYPPKVRTLIEKFGSSKITSAELRRSPVQSVLTSAMNALTFGKFKKNMSQTPYDRLFHLQIVLTLENGSKLLLEKNEVINMELSPTMNKETEVKTIKSLTSATLNDALEKTKASMGSKAYFDYNAENNNCQDFILSFLKSNGWGDASDYAFVKQDTKKLFKGLSGLAKTAYTLTELGERANVAITGKGAKKSKVAPIPTAEIYTTPPLGEVISAIPLQLEPDDPLPASAYDGLNFQAVSERPLPLVVAQRPPNPYEKYYLDREKKKIAKLQKEWNELWRNRDNVIGRKQYTIMWQPYSDADREFYDTKIDILSNKMEKLENDIQEIESNLFYLNDDNRVFSRGDAGSFQYTQEALFPRVMETRTMTPLGRLFRPSATIATIESAYTPASADASAPEKSPAYDTRQFGDASRQAQEQLSEAQRQKSEMRTMSSEDVNMGGSGLRLHLKGHSRICGGRLKRSANYAFGDEEPEYDPALVNDEEEEDDEEEEEEEDDDEEAQFRDISQTILEMSEETVDLLQQELLDIRNGVINYGNELETFATIATISEKLYAFVDTYAELIEILNANPTITTAGNIRAYLNDYVRSPIQPFVEPADWEGGLLFQ